MKTLIYRYIFCILALWSVCSTVNAEKAQRFYVFGDSLSDIGNVHYQTASSGFPIPIPPQARYYQGRFSNGANASELLWEAVGNSSQLQPILTLTPENINLHSKSQAISFAYGGSESNFENSVLGQFNVIGLLGQVGMFRVIKTNDAIDNSALALVWSGANDYLNQFGKGSIASVDQVIGNIAKAIRNLHASGIRQFIVPNLPDLGEVPIANILATTSGNPNIPGILSNQTIQHNLKLEKALIKLQNLPNIKIYKTDIYAAVKAVITAEAIIPGPAAGCLYNPVISAESCSPVDFDSGNNLIFWDEIHPTTRIHKILADAMIDSIKK